MRKLFKEKRRDAEEMSEEEEIERKEIDRLRRRFPSNGRPYIFLLEGGFYHSPYLTEDPRKIAIRRSDPSFHGNIWSW